jgi:hypothetical protein
LLSSLWHPFYTLRLKSGEVNKHENVSKKCPESRRKQHSYPITDGIEVKWLLVALKSAFGSHKALSHFGFHGGIFGL